ncbi:hypothetical protein WBG78_26495 [Chryseolinea sp. T2]|uniref:hypothetical protein n=1 Tax=Chryseolinea sp. T2 TaxID=3129255 RepID=UPI0030782D41
MKLTEEQIAIIRSHIRSSGIKLKPLQDDILDHLCCVLEENQQGITDFETRLQAAIQDLAPGGLPDIERQTLYLLNSKKFIYMKKLMYLIGLGSSITLAMGLCFKLLNWQGCSELFIYGFLSFTLLFLPMTIVDRFRLRIHTSLSLKLRYLLGATSAIVAGLAFLFKIMHLSGADQLLLIATVIFSFGFLPFLYFTNYRKAVQQHFQKH